MFKSNVGSEEDLFKTFEVINTHTNQIIERFYGSYARYEANKKLNSILNVYGPNSAILKIKGNV